MTFFDKLNQVAKNIGDKTNDAIETTKLSSKINAEQSAAVTVGIICPECGQRMEE